MLLLIVLIAWFYSTLLHELSHAWFAWTRGATVKIFPFWHWLHTRPPYPMSAPWNRPPMPRRFYFARIRWNGGNPQKAEEHAAPLLGDVFTIAWSTVFALAIHEAWPLVFVATSLIDAMVWGYGYFWGGPHTDGQKFKAAGSAS